MEICHKLHRAYFLGKQNHRLIEENDILFSRMLDEDSYKDFQAMEQRLIRNSDYLKSQTAEVHDMSPLEKIAYKTALLLGL